MLRSYQSGVTRNVIKIQLKIKFFIFIACVLLLSKIFLKIFKCIISQFAIQIKNVATIKIVLSADMTDDVFHFYDDVCG
jgi:hypothetical protein